MNAKRKQLLSDKNTRRGQFKWDHHERCTYQQIPKAYTKYNKFTIQQLFQLAKSLLTTHSADSLLVLRPMRSRARSLDII